MTILQDIVSKSSDFGIKYYINEHLLDECRVTSFTWTTQPFALVLSANRKYYNQAFANPNVNGIVATPSSVCQLSKDDNHDKAIIVADKAAELFYYLHNKAIHKKYLGKDETFPLGISPSASIAPTALIGNRVEIGDDVEIGPYCVVMDNTRIGRGTVLHPFVSVGTEGFFSKILMGRKTHVRHFGGVIIGENCVIHTGSNISRSVNYSEYTSLNDNVHIGIHSNVGHDCMIGEGTDISAKVLLAGRVRVGRNCWIGANVAIANALSIGDKSILRIGAVVIDNVNEQGELSGNFALEHRTNLKKFLRAKK